MMKVSLKTLNQSCELLQALNARTHDESMSAAWTPFTGRVAVTIDEREDEVLVMAVENVVETGAGAPSPIATMRKSNVIGSSERITRANLSLKNGGQIQSI